MSQHWKCQPAEKMESSLRLLSKPQDRRQRRLPLPVRYERGEGRLHADWNGVCKQDGPPLPSPLLPRREEREKRCAFSSGVQSAIEFGRVATNPAAEEE